MLKDSRMQFPSSSRSHNDDHLPVGDERPVKTKEISVNTYQQKMLSVTRPAIPNKMYTPRYVPKFCPGRCSFAVDHQSSHMAVQGQQNINSCSALTTYLETLSKKNK